MEPEARSLEIREPEVLCNKASKKKKKQTWLRSGSEGEDGCLSSLIYRKRKRSLDLEIKGTYIAHLR